MTSIEPFGVYVHFPWCLKKCPYCDFVSYAAKVDDVDHRGYADGVLAELEARASAFEGRTLASVFFGGGTPSLWHPRELGRVLAGVLAKAGASRDVEITVECNPTSLDEASARALRDQGVNRLSVGVQGLDADRLRFLGRLHDPMGGLAAVTAAVRSGMPRVSADIIYGVSVPDPSGEAGPEGPPGRMQTAAEARDEARRVAETGVTHVSAYALTIEPATQFGELAKRGRLPIAPDDAVIDAFLAVDEALEQAGLAHYEISNFAVPGAEARHNLGYWRGHDYLGLGCAAYGTVSGASAAHVGPEAADLPPGAALRYRNLPDPRKYLEVQRSGARPVESVEVLDAETRLRERIMLGLRLAAGLDLERSARDLGADPWPAARRRAATRMIAAGRLVEEGPVLRIPRAAWALADGTASALF